MYQGVEYDENGTPLTSSLATYAMPTAVELPSFENCRPRRSESGAPSQPPAPAEFSTIERAGDGHAVIEPARRCTAGSLDGVGERRVA